MDIVIGSWKKSYHKSNEVVDQNTILLWLLHRTWLRRRKIIHRSHVIVYSRIVGASVVNMFLSYQIRQLLHNAELGSLNTSRTRSRFLSTSAPSSILEKNSATLHFAHWTFHNVYHRPEHLYSVLRPNSSHESNTFPPPVHRGDLSDNRLPTWVPFNLERCPQKVDVIKADWLKRPPRRSFS